MSAFASIALFMAGFTFAGSCLAAVIGKEEASRHNQRHAIGWAIASALFFIASRMPA